MDSSEIQTLLSQGKIRQALDAIKKSIENDDPRKKDVLELSAQYSMLERDEMMGLLMREDINISKNKLIKSLLELIM
ncbi:MAG: hypothetical protein AAFR87_17555 [Bacteroidota bacterium]